MTKLLMLDLDGTVRRTRSGQTFINNPSDQEIIPEAFAAIQRYKAEGWSIVGITNQLGVKEGHKTMENCIAEQKFTLGLVTELDRILFCPDDGWTCYQVNGAQGWPQPLRCFSINDLADWRDYEGLHKLAGKYRKPAPGILRYAIFSYTVRGVQLDTFYVGDRPEDAAAAELAGVPFAWAQQWYGWEVNANV